MGCQRPGVIGCNSYNPMLVAMQQQPCTAERNQVCNATGQVDGIRLVPVWEGQIEKGALPLEQDVRPKQTPNGDQQDVQRFQHHFWADP